MSFSWHEVIFMICVVVGAFNLGLVVHDCTHGQISVHTAVSTALVVTAVLIGRLAVDKEV